MVKLSNLIKTHLIYYPISLNLNYMWSFGALSGIFLFIQLATGFLLAAHYNPDATVAFENMEHIMRDVKYGWLWRYLHANSASMYFICIYIHILRGIYYKSFVIPRNEVWFSGVLILLLSIIVAFIGYVLPWGQMSFWGATVITNLLTAIPWVGDYAVIGLWGSFSLSEVTLVRFYDFHYILALVLTVLVIFHLSILHEVGSSNSLSLEILKEKISFYRYYVTKDTYLFFIFLTILAILVFFYPNLLAHPDNYIKANALVTPSHIVPEWYFLPFYAILRSIEDKFWGVVMMIASILIIGTLGCFTYFYMKNEVLNIYNYNFFFWIFFVSTVVLWFVGGLPAEYPYIQYGQVFTYVYFFNFIFYYYYIAEFKHVLIDEVLIFHKPFSK